MKKLEQIKQLGRLIGYILKTIWQVIRNKNIWIAVGFIVWTYLVAFFNANYYTQSPVKEWQPIVVSIYKAVKPIKKASNSLKKVLAKVKAPVVPLSEEQIVKGAKYGDELWNIYMLESTRGKADNCRKSGKFGGFGVMGLNGPQCYDTFEYAVERAEYWYTRIRKDNDLATSVCIWNLGTKVDNCMYYQKFMSL